MSRFLPALCLLASLSPTVHAAKVKVWSHSTPTHYEKAAFKGALVSSEGAVRLSRQLKPLAGLDASHVWDVVEDRDGNLFVATGEEGKVFKVTPDGKASVAFQAEDSQVLCLTLGGDGAVYAGTGPGGKVLRLDAKGGKVFCDTGETYVWSLALDPASNTLVAGTGPHGKVYKVEGEGKASVFYATKQDHVLCVAAGAGGLVYAGTDKNGVVYKIDAKGKGFVLYQATQSEVRALSLVGDAVYVGTSATGSRRRTTSGTTTSAGGAKEGAEGEKPAKAVPTSGSREKKVSDEFAADNSSAPSSSKEKEKESKGSPAPAPPAPATGENSVYRIAADGTVREVFREKALVLSLLKLDGKLLVGTGMEGQLFEVDEATRERSELARLDHGQVLCLLRRKDGSIVLGTGDPGKLYVVQDKYAVKGTVTSEVQDAKLSSKWGAVRWQADTPAGTTLTFATRTGNVSEPDETWSDWTPEQSDGQNASVTAPTARYLQYRVTLTSADGAATPSLRGLAVRYRNTNQAPEVAKVEVPDLNATNLDNPKKLRFKWTATDANEDELGYDLFVRKDGWPGWVRLEEDVDKTDYDWDTTTAASGVYRFKVVANDRRDNAEGEALTAERISGSFVVCHTPPAVTLKVVGHAGGRAVVEAAGDSPLVRLVGAQFAVDGRKWANVFPADDLFDSKAEKFRFKTEALKPGTHVLVLKVKDAAGNTGSADVVFTIDK